MYRCHYLKVSRKVFNKKKLASSFRWFKGIKQKDFTPQHFTPYVLDTVLYSHDFLNTIKHCVTVESLHFFIEYLIFLLKLLLI